jgi:hypothetical protein
MAFPTAPSARPTWRDSTARQPAPSADLRSDTNLRALCSSAPQCSSAAQ